MSDKAKSSFVLYHDIRGPLKLLHDDQIGRLFLAILDYSEFGIVPDFDGAMQMAFAFIQTALDRDAAAWEEKRQKRQEAGGKGGQQTAAKRASAADAEQNQANPAYGQSAEQNRQEPANQAVPAPVLAPDPVPVPVPGSASGSVPASEDFSSCDKPTRTKRFTPPTVEEVAAYCRERGNQVDPHRFVDFYTSKGWRIGKSPMKDWQAAVRTWEQSGTNSSENVSGNVFFDIAREEGLL